MPSGEQDRRAKLTLADVKRAASRDTEYELFDAGTPGLSLRVLPTGRKVWRYKYKMGRRGEQQTRRMTIGDFPTFTLDQARREALQLAAGVDAARRGQGQDPAAARADVKAAVRSEREAPIVAELFDAFLADRRAKQKKASTLAEYERLLGVTPIKRGPDKGGERVGELRAALGALKVRAVTRARIAKLHDAMHGRPYLANRALAILAAAFSFAELREMRPKHSNPCEGIDAYPERARECYLTDGEMIALGEALQRAESEGLPLPPNRQRRRRATEQTAKHRRKAFGALEPANPVAVAALRFLMLTGWREQEALTLQWDHIDTERRVAMLPDTKTGKSERPLTPPALALLGALRLRREAGSYPPPKHEGGSAFVFPGTKPGRPFRDVGRVWDAVRHAAGLDCVRLHDLRHNFASVAISEAKLSLPYIGALLGHKDTATTKRYAHLTDTALAHAAEQVGDAFTKLGVVPARAQLVG